MKNSINQKPDKGQNTRDNSNADEVASGAGMQKPLERARDLDSDSNSDVYDANGILGDKAEKYIRESANIEDLPGDDEDDFDEEDDESIELDEEIEIESEEISDNDIETGDDPGDDFDAEEEEDDDIL